MSSLELLAMGFRVTDGESRTKEIAMRLKSDLEIGRTVGAGNHAANWPAMNRVIVTVGPQFLPRGGVFTCINGWTTEWYVAFAALDECEYREPAAPQGTTHGVGYAD